MKTIATLIASALIGLGLFAVPAHAAQQDPAPWSGHCWKTGNYSAAFYAKADRSGRVLYWAHRCTDRGIRYDVTRANNATEVSGLRAMVRDSNSRPGAPAIFCRTSATTAYSVEWSGYTRRDFTEQPGEQARYTAWVLDWKRNHGCA